MFGNHPSRGLSGSETKGWTYTPLHVLWASGYELLPVYNIIIIIVIFTTRFSIILKFWFINVR